MKIKKILFIVLKEQELNKNKFDMGKNSSDRLRFLELSNEINTDRLSNKPVKFVKKFACCVTEMGKF